MEILNILREDPTMAGLALVALLIVILPIAAFSWRRIFGRDSITTDKLPAPAPAAKPTRFGNRTELILLLAGLLLSLAISIRLIKSFSG